MIRMLFYGCTRLIVVIELIANTLMRLKTEEI